jgi:hypothetical protein
METVTQQQQQQPLAGPTHTDSDTMTQAFIYTCSNPVIFSNSYNL